ncbi:unnamed protein product [Rhizophagus irregularis]|nr:unnamed protein product [Rhizophagus irregularis]
MAVGLFKNVAEPSKNYMLTVKHSVKEEGSESVFQPGKFDKIENWKILGMPNVPLGSNITITKICNINSEINENDNQALINDIVNYGYVQKIGRSTFTTGGMKGDSGSPVFDMHGRLWGINVTGGHPFYYVVPIEWILNDVRERFNATFIRKPEIA